MREDESDLLDLIWHSVFVLEKNKDGQPRYVGMNRRALTSLGKEDSDVVGKTAIELYPGRQGEVAYRHHQEAFRTGRERHYEIQLPLRGMERMVRTTLMPVADSEGRVWRVVGSSEDISGRQILRRLRAEVETLAGEVDVSPSFSNHGLDGPIRNAQLLSQMVREDFKDLGDGKLEMIAMLEEVACHAMGMIGDVLAVADATSAVERTTGFDFADLVDELMAVLDPESRVDYSAPAGEVFADRTAMMMILKSLFNNALTHAKPRDEAERPKLSVDLSSITDGFLAISVADNGPGFDDPKSIFKDGANVRDESGLGLLGVRRLVRARNGDIDIANLPDRAGAAITFTLPGALAAGWERRSA